MTFLVPGFLWAALAVAAGIVALHFIVTRQPRASILPTARFVPDSSATAVARNARPSDLLLMLLRVIVVLAAGAGIAKPVIEPSTRGEGRVILVDVSRSVGNAGELSDSVKALYRDGDALIAFDSAARPLGSKVRDSLGVLRLADTGGNLSAAIIAAIREGSQLRDRVDSLELVIVSPFMEVEHDAATDSIRKLWPGRARMVRVSPRVDSAAPVFAGGITLRSDASDPLAVAVGIAAREQRSSLARITRGTTIGVEDSSWVVAGNRAVILWPIAEPPRFTVPRPRPDQIGGLVGDEARIVSVFDRRWMFPADSLLGTRVMMRWADGEPAAVERRMERGCVRSVAIPVAVAGDLVIRREFVRLMEEITGPCGGGRSTALLSPEVVASLAGRGILAPRDDFSARGDMTSPLAPWLFGLALLAALAELLVRSAGDASHAERPVHSIVASGANP